MANDSVTETTSQGWFSRIGGAITGALFGVLLFLGSFPLLLWNEGRAIKTETSLKNGSKEVVAAPAKPIDASKEGKLVYVTGDMVTGGAIRDTKFGISAPAVKLRRDVEMYQWTENKKSETKKNLGGSEDTVTTYTYEKKWSPTLIDSDKFHKPDGHANPEQMRMKEQVYVAKTVTVGDFTLPDSLVDKLGDFKPLEVGKKEAAAAADNLSVDIKAYDDGFYVGKNPEAAEVGDLKIHFQVVETGPVSIVARQVQDTFEPYQRAGDDEIEMIDAGKVSADRMFAEAAEGNRILTWILRFVGWLMMFLGMLLIGAPLSVLADVLPFLGDLLGTGMGLIALVISVPLTLLTVALSWLAFRPLFGIPLLLLALGSVVLGVRALMKKRAALKAKAA